MVSWVGSNGLKNQATWTQPNPRLRVKIQSNPTQSTNLQKPPTLIGILGEMLWRKEHGPIH